TCVAAAEEGQLGVLRWLREEVHCEWDGRTLATALFGGHWEVIEYARKHGCPVNANAIRVALQGGYAEVLQWMFDAAGQDITLDQKWCERAANVQVLKVLRDRGCEWSEATC